MENLFLSKKVIRSNKRNGIFFKKLGRFYNGKNILGSCKLKCLPIKNLLCGGIKTTSSINRPLGVFYNQNSIILANMVKGVNYLKFSDNMTNLPLSYIHTNANSYKYIKYLKYSTQVSAIYNMNYNLLYRASGGNYALYMGSFKNLGLSVFKLPSGVKVRLPYWSLCLVGRTIGIFNKYRVFGSFKFYNIKKKKKFSTRGVAMNPVDHHNGGRTKSKTPFYSKYNRIAKKGK